MRRALKNITKNTATLFISLCLLATTPTILAETNGLPERFSATYKLVKGPLTLGEMTRTLSPNEDGSFTYDSYSKPVGYARWFTDSTLTERSDWIHHNNSLRPLSYSYIRKGDNKDRDVELKFDWDKKHVINRINNDPWKMEIPDSTMDKLLYQLALMHDLQIGRTELKYDVADGGTLKKYEFEILGKEKIKIGLGSFETVKVKRVGSRETVLWCAIDLNYMPVRIEQDDKHGLLRMNLINFSGIERK